VLVIDIDATIVVCHSEKESAAATFSHSFGFHPVLAFCDNSNEALAGMLRPGNAGSNTAAHLIAVLDAALAQIPDEFRHGYPTLVRTDGAGASKALLAHTRGLREHGVHTEFTVGWAVTEREHAAIAAVPKTAGHATRYAQAGSARLGRISGRRISPTWSASWSSASCGSTTTRCSARSTWWTGRCCLPTSRCYLSYPRCHFRPGSWPST
jgi:hypothetical protein